MKGEESVPNLSAGNCSRGIPAGGRGLCVCSFTQLKLNWYKAADKGALCRTRGKLTHAEVLVSQVGVLSRGKKSPQSVSLCRFPAALGCRQQQWWEPVSPWNEAGQAA